MCNLYSLKKILTVTFINFIDQLHFCKHSINVFIIKLFQQIIVNDFISYNFWNSQQTISAKLNTSTIIPIPEDSISLYLKQWLI